MIEENNFQKRVQQIGELVRELDSAGDPAVRTQIKQLVQLLMELHGTGLERMLEIVFESQSGGAPVIDEMGRDPLVSSLLILYGLHPEELEVRVARKLGEVRSKIYKMGAEATLISVENGEVRVRCQMERHACGSTTQNLRAVLEEAVYEAAPDLKSLAIEGLDEPGASGFVGVEKLIGDKGRTTFAVQDTSQAQQHALGGGMD